VAETLMDAAKIMANMPAANIGKANFSRRLLLVIMSPIGIVFLNLTPTDDKLVQHLSGSKFLIKRCASKQLLVGTSSGNLAIG